MQNNPLHLSADQLADLDPQELHRLARQSSGFETASKLAMRRCLLAIDRTQSYLLRGSSSVHHFAAIELQIHKRKAQELMLVARRLELLTILTQAALTGQIYWSALELVSACATPDDEAEWLRKAQTCTVGRLARMARRRSRGPAGEAVKVQLCVDWTPEEQASFQRVLRDMSEEEGRRLALRECLHRMCVERITGTFSPSEQDRERVLAQAARDVAAVEELEAPWAAVAADESPCPGNDEVQLVQPAEVEWRNPRVHFNPDSRGVTPAQREEILRRDAYHCAIPGCPNMLWLHVHYVVFWYEGGVTIPDNLVAVCSCCHSCIHQGAIRLRERAPNELSWTDHTGRELAQLSTERPPVWWGRTDISGRAWAEEFWLSGPG